MSAMTTADYLISTRDLRVTPTPWTRSYAIGVHDLDDLVLDNQNEEDLNCYNKWLTDPNINQSPYRYGFVHRANDILLRTERIKAVMESLSNRQRPR
jgi:hypothetical protein